MLANVPLDRVLQLVGDRRPTSTKALAITLRALGRNVPGNKLRVWPKTLRNQPLTAIAKVVYNGTGRHRWHWVAIIDGVIHDPLSSEPGKLHAGRITSYLAVSADDDLV
jgi:hypothetical protein